MRGCLTVLVVTLALPLSLFAADWPQFMGPDRNGTSPEHGLARSWGPGGPPVLWTTRVSDGFAGPAVRDGKVYLQDRIGIQADALICLSLADGKELWRYQYDAPGTVNRSFPGARSTPSVEDKYVFMVGPLGHVTCISQETHQPLWQKNLVSDYGGEKPGWGVSQSPLTYGDTVVVAPQTRQVGVVAFDKATGRELWKSPPVGQLQYVTPTMATVDGVDQVVVAGKKGENGVNITGIEAATGKLLWTYDQWECGIPIAMPTILSEGRFLISGGYGAGCSMFQVSRQGDQWSARTLFHNDNCKAQIHPAILWQDHLYANSTCNEAQEGLLCLDLEGKIVWKTNNTPNLDRGNMLLADGLLYALGARGVLYLIEPSATGYKELAKATLLEGNNIWGPMALSNGKLLIRDRHQLRCLDVATKP